MIQMPELRSATNICKQLHLLASCKYYLWMYRPQYAEIDVLMYIYIYVDP